MRVATMKIRTKIRVVLYVLLSACLSACGALSGWQEKPPQLSTSKPPLTAPPSYLRVHKQAQHPRLSQLVVANFAPGETSLQTAITSALPFRVSLVPLDTRVDLTRQVSVRANEITVGEYLQQLEGITGYSIRPNKDVSVIHLASVETRTWNLAALASIGNFKARLGFDESGSGDDGDSGDSFRSSHEMAVQREHSDSVWSDMLNQARCVLGAPTCGASTSLPGQNNSIFNPSFNPSLSPSDAQQTNNADTWLVDNRRLGIVTASGSPQQIKHLDKWMRELISESARLVYLECAILDISTDNLDSLGVQLSTLFESGDVSAALSRPRTVDDDSGLLIGVGLEGIKFDLDALIDNLSTVGDIRIHSRTKFSVTNGATAYLNTGEVFSYISNADTTVNETGTTQGFEQSRLQVGLQLAITPRFLSTGERLLLEVTPVLSSLLGFDELSSGDEDIRTPIIALRQMTSQSITTSGRPIAIGGLEWHRSAEREEGFFAPAFIRKLLANRSQTNESRQLLIIVTPWEIS